jgi:hypothetical protein
MKLKRLLIVAVAWVASLFGVGLWAQNSPPAPIQAPVIQMGQPAGPIMTGADIGFQPVAAPPDREGRIAGKLMVRINGHWHEAASAMQVAR